MRGGGWLVTGGTGAFGQALVRRLLAEEYGPERVVVFSRDEHKQQEMVRRLRSSWRGGSAGSSDPTDRLRFFLGDVRDRMRLKQAMAGCDVVIHAAALKVVPALEYNPAEGVKTNVGGALNVVQAALAVPSVRRVVALSSDKACSPVNLYGATKLVAERVVMGGNRLRGGRDLWFNVVRYGNVAGSTGSVLKLWAAARDEGTVPKITDPAMSRFWMTLDEAVAVVMFAARHARGGIVVPDLPAYRLADLATACGWDVGAMERVGLRPGEKLHETMISADEAWWTLKQVGDAGRYVILPDPEDRVPTAGHWSSMDPLTFRLRSDEVRAMGVDELRDRVAAL